MKKKILVTVKTYPLSSEKYQEIVCTAGVDEAGNWYRLYPISFRDLPYDQQYKKWDWIELDIEKNTSDFRPESYHLANMEAKIEIVGSISAKGWDLRKEFVLRKVYTDFQELLTDAHNDSKLTSLAVYKPSKVVASYRKENHGWTGKDLELFQQLNIFFNHDLKPMKVLPYLFRYEFYDEAGKCHRLRITDWEIYSLYWNCYSKYKDETVACKLVLDKLNSLYTNNDLYLFLGTTPGYHARKVPNPFMVIGLFYPPNDDQQIIQF
jgi:hypothetical protein